MMGSNPWQESDGTGVTSDTEAVKAEEQQWGDFLRVPAVHHAGSEGRSRVIRDMWQRIPLQHEAKFYIKSNVCSSPSLHLLLFLVHSCLCLGVANALMWK